MKAPASPQGQDTGTRLLSACADSGEESVRPCAPPKMERERSEVSSGAGQREAHPPIGPVSHDRVTLSLRNRGGPGGEPPLRTHSQSVPHMNVSCVS